MQSARTSWVRKHLFRSSKVKLSPSPNKMARNSGYLKYPKDFQVNVHCKKPTISTTRHQFFSEFKELIYAIAICGRFPFQRNISGAVKYSFVSAAGFYWLVVYSIFVAAAARQFIAAFASILSDRYDVVINSSRKCAVLLAAFFIPLGHFIEFKYLAHFINEMDEFLVNFERLTGKKLKIRARRLSLILTLSCPIFALGGTTLQKDQLGIENFSQQSLYVMLYCGQSYVSWFFFFSQLTVWRVADYLKLELAKVSMKSKKRIRISSERIQKLKRIWVKGMDLLLQSGRAVGFTIIVVVLISSAMVILSCYGLIRSISTTDYESGFHHFANLFANTIFLLTCCESGYTSSKKMGNEITTVLSSVDLTGVSELVSMEITIFLQIISVRPPVITCGGLITLSRSFITSVFSNTLTYLIVLMQFKKTVSDLIDTTSPASIDNNVTSNNHR